MEDLSMLWPGWELTRILGSGAHGTVYLARNTSGGATNLAAVKIVSVRPDERLLQSVRDNGISQEALRSYLRRVQNDLSWELTLYKTDRSPHMGSVEDFCFVDDSDGPGFTGYIRTPVYTALVEKYGRQPSKPEALRMIYSAGEALRGCEARSGVHGGVRPSNIMITENGDFVLCDFALGRCLSRTVPGMFRDPEAFYNAPETKNGEFTHASDVYFPGHGGKDAFGGERRGKYLPGAGQGHGGKPGGQVFLRPGVYECPERGRGGASG
ncbi:MAG: protein kinase family protein [Oscillospiraceae bacterium]|nr:protein kinase family protein [Oscillospiraceae bacterium]